MQRRNANFLISALLVFLLVSTLGTFVAYLSKSKEVDSLNARVSSMQKDLDSLRVDNTTKLPTPTKTPPVIDPIINDDIPPLVDESNTDKVKVYFSKDPSSYDDASIIVVSDRDITNPEITISAMNELLKGPTTQEKTQGYFTPFKLTGTSNCGTAPYSVTVSGGKATLKFCKTIEPITNGGYAGTTLRAQQRTLYVLFNTLKSDPSVSTVIIRDMNGNCFGKDADSANLNSCS